ncbi:uncharacterized protein EDB91DRAFT_1082694 [Suillus paluster]|uniref:uncharacterized protein n=1 Tax=Suillus paluster TaxID=48578 RepID=UPI001B86ADD1|nr:uncharacterized protein EDB91DRAFT_1082694 [Suillus paluster]KAG1738662.1 hypothetical protein EDB91DRAFT_1082694 [Suillus paluster]
MARSGHSTQLTSRRHRIHQPQSQKLTGNKISELKNYLPEWTSAKRSEKWGVFNAIARAARLFAPKVDQGQWKKRKQVIHPCYVKDLVVQQQEKKERKDMIKYGRKWTPRQVIYQQNREEVLKRIEDEFRAKPGGQDMFKHYQAVVKKVMADLSEDELEKAKETTKEWSNNFPPPETQAQVAHKKGPVYMEHFLNEMWRQCGMRVFVLSAWKNEHGEVLFRMHNDNEALGDGDSFMKTKDWEDIEPVWQEYTQEQFDITETKLEEKKAIVRAFLTKHYRICSGIDKAGVPWSAIVQSQDDFVARQYLPADVNLKEPSKLQNWDTTALLNFWYARQKMGEGPMFLFKAWRNKEGDMRKRVMIWRPRDSSTESESEAEGPGDVEHEVPLPAPKSFWGKKDVIEAPARTTRSKSVQQPSDRVTRARGNK